MGAAVYGDDLAEIYDAIYLTGVGKDYHAEAAGLAGLIRQRCPDADSLLDVACGTGEHLWHLRQSFGRVEGLDSAEAMLHRAAAKLPGVPLHIGDLRGFDLGRRFDAVTCLFSAIGYVRGRAELHAGVAAMAAHLNPGGVLVIEPWITPEQWRDGSVHHMVAETAAGVVVRVAYSSSRDRTSSMTMHYLVAESGAGVRHFTDEHVMSLFTIQEYLDAFTAAGCVEVRAVPGRDERRPRLVGSRAR